MIYSPLDQFKIAPLITFQVAGIDLSVTNFLLASLVTLFMLQSLVFLIKEPTTNSFFIIPSGWQNIIEKIYSLVTQLLSDIITTGSEKYFPVAIVLFMFILTNNLIGMVPYSFTTTSHITLTFFLSFSIFVAMNVIGFQKHGMEFFSLFLPANTTFFLALILVPIELISFIAKPVSLGVRLFINLMAGHSLLKVIVGFSWNMLLVENLTAIAFIIPLAVLVVLMGLELGVALIQAYVFITLTAIYLNDSEALH
uniref:ATP synthase subunit a n=3 Tax=Nitzschia TaxID=2857 RepID=A0A2Z5ZAI3_9STRA|nr:ATPase subunit 6 [Nitzschia sp. (in: diatoms)]AWQ64282.1 ATPase subunit 6 [Nitzschia sp. (in: diatoms)]BBC77770.1 ATP synthase F0 subunit a [Nitzschia sp. NIES-3581]BCQ06485.1 ATP synthase F0 subunit a [Nitzschia putrida]